MIQLNSARIKSNLDPAPTGLAHYLTINLKMPHHRGHVDPVDRLIDLIQVKVIRLDMRPAASMGQD